MTYFRNFRTPSISRERLVLETPNFASGFITRGTNDRNAKLGQKGSGRGHVTYFRNFRTPSISRERLEPETPNFACRFITRGTKDRNAKLGQKGTGRGHVTYFRNLAFLALTIHEISRGFQISKVGHVTPSWPLLTQFCISVVSTPGDESACIIWRF